MQLSATLTLMSPLVMPGATWAFASLWMRQPQHIDRGATVDAPRIDDEGE